MTMTLVCAAAFFALGFVVAQWDTTNPTAVMTQITTEAILAGDLRYNPYANRRRLMSLSAADEEAAKRPGHLYSLAIESLNAGLTGDAISLLETLYAENPDTPRLGVVLATAYLRQSEQLNCTDREAADYCIFPLSETAIHDTGNAALNAQSLLLEMLRESPGDLTLIWLVNVASMTIGRYETLPAKWRIPNEAFASERQFRQFRDVADNVDADIFGLAGSTVVDDFDGDNDLDIIATSWSESARIVYLENRGGSFVDRSAQTGLGRLPGGLNLIHGDYNNDGLLDVFILRGGWLGPAGRIPNSLLRNDGDGRFTDVTRQVGLLSFKPTQSATFADFDNDGWLDLAIANESVPGLDNANEIFRNDNGHFTNIAPDIGMDLRGFYKGIASGDIDNDGKADLYLSEMGADNTLYVNVSTPGNIRFKESSHSKGPSLPVNGFPAWFFDLNNDGWLDLFAAAFPAEYGDAAIGAVAADYLGRTADQSEESRLYVNAGNGRLDDQTASSGLNRPIFIMGSNYGDLDNDGFPDMYLGTGAPSFAAIIPNRMFLNDGENAFLDVTTAGGFGHLQKGHGIAFADWDEDGDQDVYAVMGGAYEGDGYFNALFENPGFDNDWIKVRLIGKRSNRAAIGARMRFHVTDEDGAERTVYGLVGPGGSFGNNPLRLEIGLGQTSKHVRSEVLWPGQTEWKVIQAAPANSLYCLTEGEGEMEAC